MSKNSNFLTCWKNSDFIFNKMGAIIYNSDVTKELRDGGKISLRDAIPNQLAEKVVPVMEVNPKFYKNKLC